MRIFVRAKPKAKKRMVQKTSEQHYTVLVPEDPKEGKANEAILDELAKYFNVSKNTIVMESGETSHNKVYIIQT